MIKFAWHFPSGGSAVTRAGLCQTWINWAEISHVWYLPEAEAKETIHSTQHSHFWEHGYSKTPCTAIKKRRKQLNFWLYLSYWVLAFLWHGTDVQHFPRSSTGCRDKSFAFSVEICPKFNWIASERIIKKKTNQFYGSATGTSLATEPTLPFPNSWHCTGFRRVQKPDLGTWSAEQVVGNNENRTGNIIWIMCIVGLRVVRGVFETRAPSGKYNRRWMLSEQAEGPEEGTWPGCWVLTGLVQTPTRHPTWRERTWKQVMHLFECNQINQSDWPSGATHFFLFSVTQPIVRAIFSFLIANYRVSVASFFPSSDSAKCNCSFKWK